MTNRRQDSLDVQLAPADLSIYDPKIHPENVIYLALGFRHEASQNTGTMAGATTTMSLPWSIPRPRLFVANEIMLISRMCFGSGFEINLEKIHSQIAPMRVNFS